MFPVLRILAVAVALFAASLGRGAAQELAPADRSAALAALASAQRNDWGPAYAQAAQSRDPLPLNLVRWLDYTRNTPGGRFAEISEFITRNPDWPYQKTLERHAEAALASESDDTAAAWLKSHAPISAVGKVRQGELMIKAGQVPEGTALLRAAWAEDDFLPIEERAFWAKYGATMRPEDNVKRLYHLLWAGDNDGARRMLPLVPADNRAVAEARLALAANAKDIAAAIGRVPPQLQTDPGLAFDEARWRRKQDMNDEAAKLLLAHPDSPAKPTLWWAERQIVARRLLAGGNADLAYQVAQQHGLTDGFSYSEAEFLAGYIALRYFKKPELAFDHFSHILTRVASPYAKSRAAYWSGRAAEAQGKHDLAVKWYTAGAENMATFYGQLSAHQLGHDAPPRPVTEPRASATDQSRFEANDIVRAAALFASVGDREHTRVFVTAMADKMQSQLDFAMLASFAETHGRIDLAIVVARKAMEAGTPLMVHGYPVTPLPAGGTLEPSLVYAIVRQESGFDQYAVSRAGARGLMQLMPGTASTLARKMQVGYTADRLTSDGGYNVLLGRTYLEGLIEDFGGSYALAIAGYNAGPGRIRQWLRDYGDPRGRDVSMVDWIETIPFTETRIYVERVLENLQVYRGQNTGGSTDFSLASDLAR